MTVLSVRGWRVPTRSRRNPDALTSADVAEILGVSTSTVRRRAAQGKLPFYWTVGGRQRGERRYRESEIRQLARALGVTTEEPSP